MEVVSLLDAFKGTTFLHVSTGKLNIQDGFLTEYLIESD